MASRPGCPAAANSSARCGATAATWRLTGQPTGCTGKPWHCATCAPSKRYDDPTSLPAAEQGALDAAVRAEMRRNTYDPESGRVLVSADRRTAIRQVARHYDGLYGSDPALAKLRDQYAMMDGTLPEAADRKALAAFFFWSAWAASTDRPGETGLSYTSNWPHEPLVGNTLTSSAAIWSMVSIVLLLAGIAAMLWLHGRAGTRKRSSR